MNIAMDDRWTDGRTDGWLDEMMNVWPDKLELTGWMDGLMDEQKASNYSRTRGS